MRGLGWSVGGGEVRGDEDAVRGVGGLLEEDGGVGCG